MIGLALPEGPLSVLCLAAHPDDIEIGCGGTLLALAERSGVAIDAATLTGTGERLREAEVAAQSFGIRRTTYFGLPDGRLPAHWDEAKQSLEDLAREGGHQLIFCPSRLDGHQDHRLIGELVPTVWRDALVLEYEIPKWDGDVAPATTYVPLGRERVRQKIDLLTQCFPSQTSRDWWDEEVFVGRMRMRGMECRSVYAEAFVARRSVLQLGT